MLITSRRLFNKDQTGRDMYRLINTYSSDLDNVKVWRAGTLMPFSKIPLNEAYEYIRRIPYKRDIKPVEVLMRPSEIFRNKDSGIDCKKKSILLSSYLRNRGIPYRLVASSRLKNKRVHHVFPQIFVLCRWLNFDATYPHYMPFEPKAVTKVEVLK